jgi:mutual gliding-motility protein MglA
MARIDLKNKAIQAKLVYYGPGLCGKTTNLQYVNAQMANGQELMSLSTEGDRTIFFDFMPLDLGKLRGLDVQFKLYTVPGQVRYNQTRKMVLKNVDGVVFVADSQAAMVDANLESLDNLFSNLKELGIDAAVVPIVLQYNKRDLPTAMTVDELDKLLNPSGYPTYLASAASGVGVVETLKEACKHVLVHLAKSLPGRDEELGSDSRATPANGSNQVGGETTMVSPPVAAEQAKPAHALATPALARAVGMPTAPERDRFGELGRAIQELKQELEALRREHASRATREALTIDSALEKLCHTTAAKSDVVVLHQRVDKLATKSDLEELTGLLRSLAETPRSSAREPSAAPDDGRVELVRGELATLRTQLERALVGVATKRDLEELARTLKPVVSEPGARQSELEPVRSELAALRDQLSASVTRKDVTEAVGQALEGIATQSDVAAIAPKPSNAEILDALATLEKRFSHALSELGERMAGLSTASDVASLQQSLARSFERLEAGFVREAEQAPAREEPSEPSPAETSQSQSAGAESSPSETLPEAAPSETAPSETVPETAPAESAPGEQAAPAAPQSDDLADDPAHQNAARVARVMVADLYLYNKEQVEEGIRHGDFTDRNKEALADMRVTYESRVPPEVRDRKDHLALAIEALIEKKRKQLGL